MAHSCGLTPPISMSRFVRENDSPRSRWSNRKQINNDIFISQNNIEGLIVNYMNFSKHKYQLGINNNNFEY